MRCLSDADLRWLCLLAAGGVTAILITNGRFRSDERIATSIAAGVAGRRRQAEAAPLQ